MKITNIEDARATILALLAIKTDFIIRKIERRHFLSCRFTDLYVYHLRHPLRQSYRMCTLNHGIPLLYRIINMDCPSSYLTYEKRLVYFCNSVHHWVRRNRYASLHFSRLVSFHIPFLFILCWFLNYLKMGKVTLEYSFKMPI